MKKPMPTMPADIQAARDEADSLFNAMKAECFRGRITAAFSGEYAQSIYAAAPNELACG